MKISVERKFGEYHGFVSKKQSSAEGYIFAEFSKLSSCKKYIIKLLMQFLIYHFLSYEWNSVFSLFTLARLNTIWKEAFCLPIYIHVFNPLYFVIKEDNGKWLCMYSSIDKIKYKWFHKVNFSRKNQFFVLWYLSNLLGRSFFFLDFLNSIQTLCHNISNCEVL